MPVFFESIKIKDGIIFNLPWHIARMNRAMQLYYPLQPLFIDLPIEIPENCKVGLVKCKVKYSSQITAIQFEHYFKKPCETYTFGHDDNINYGHKYEDRTELNMHYHLQNNYDEVIIVKHNMITDALYSNVCLYDGKQWHTPKFPLLKGTMRQVLLDQKKIIESLILLDDMHLYSKISFINAMNDLEERIIIL
jgi:4-amino-4-deoxychorismate lyase